MKLRLLLTFLLLSPVAAVSQSLFAINGWCELGGQATVTQGLSSAGTRPLSGGAFAQGSGVQASYPKCTISVYTTGTQTIVPTFSTSTGSGVLSNPFTANVDGSYLFWVGAGCYDVVTSSGVTTGSVMPTPHTYTGICVGAGGGASVSCAVALNGSIAAFQSPSSIYCDQQMGTDFAGNGFAQSWTLFGTVNGILGLVGGGNDPGTSSVFKLAANEVRLLAPLTATSYYARLPPTPCALGQVWDVTAVNTDANGDPVIDYGCFSAGTGSGSVTSLSCGNLSGLFNCSVATPTTTPAVSFTSTAPGADYLSTATAASTVAWEQINNGFSCGDSSHAVSYDTTTHKFGCQAISVVASNQASNPSAPTLTTNGSAGSTSYTYGVVGCEDVNCTYHSAMSATATIATGNATLTSSNSINLKTFADTLYGYRFYKICRTASAGTPSSTGVIFTGAGKIFTDTGLAADGTTCSSLFASNTTILDQHCLASALPAGINVMPGAPCGVDAPPTSPNALDGEQGEQGGVPGDVNNTTWSWGGGGTSACTQGSASASWSSGNLVLNTDTTTQLNCLVYGAALPTAPYTFEAYITNITLANNGTGEICALGLRESSTGKIAAVAINPGQTVTSTTGAGGYMFQVQNWTSNSAVSAPTYYAYEPGFAYVKIQNDGSSHIVYSFSHDGVSFKQWSSQTITVPFTTAPDQLIIGGSGKAGQVATCDFDFIRRTQ